MMGDGATTNKPVWREPRAIALLMAASLTVMANATISPALPGLERAFADHPNAEMLTRLLVPAPSLSVIFCAPIAGWLADRFGRRWLLLVGIALFILMGTAGLYLPDLSAIFASRLALGVAVAMIMTAQTALIGDYYSGNRRNAMMGLQVSARNFGGFVFIALAGALAAFSPKHPFAVYGLAILVFLFVWQTIEEPHRNEENVGGKQAGDGDGHSAWVGLLAALSLLQLTTNMTFFLMPTQLPFFLDGMGYNAATMTGLSLSVLTLTGGVAALQYSRIKRVTGQSGTFALGYGSMAIGFATLSFAESPAAFLAAAAAVGIGYAIAMPGFVAIVLILAPANRRGIAGGIITAAIFLGQFASPFASIPLIRAIGFDGTFQSTALLLVALAIVSGLAALAGLSSRVRSI